MVVEPEYETPSPVVSRASLICFLHFERWVGKNDTRYSSSQVRTKISRIYFLVIFFLLLLLYLLVSHLALLFQIFSPGFSSLLLVAYTQTIPRMLVSQTTSFRLYIYWVFVFIWVKTGSQIFETFLSQNSRVFRSELCCRRLNTNKIAQGKYSRNEIV